MKEEELTVGPTLPFIHSPPLLIDPFSGSFTAAFDVVLKGSPMVSLTFALEVRIIRWESPKTQPWIGFTHLKIGPAAVIQTNKASKQVI